MYGKVKEDLLGRTRSDHKGSHFMSLGVYQKDGTTVEYHTGSAGVRDPWYTCHSGSWWRWDREQVGGTWETGKHMRCRTLNVTWQTTLAVG